MIEKLTAWMKSQIGTAENPIGTNRVKYNTDYYSSEVSGDSYPWCMTFIWDGFRLCGLSSYFCGGEKSAYCPYVVNYAKNHNQWVTSGYKEGDLLFYDWDKDGKADHVGYCAGIQAGNVVSIEGNSSNKVQQIIRYHGSVMGAYRPAYSEKSTAGSTTKPVSSGSISLPTLKKGDRGEAVKALQILLVGRGFRCGVWGADGDFGKATQDALIKYQTNKKLDADGIAGAATWKSLLGF